MKLLSLKKTKSSLLLNNRNEFQVRFCFVYQIKIAHLFFSALTDSKQVWDNDLLTRNAPSSSSHTGFKSKDNLVIKISNIPYHFDEKNVEKSFRSFGPTSVRLDPNTKGIAYVSFANEKGLKKSLMLHNGYVGGRQVQVIRVSSDLEQNVSESGQKQALTPLTNTTSNMEQNQAIQLNNTVPSELDNSGKPSVPRLDSEELENDVDFSACKEPLKNLRKLSNFQIKVAYLSLFLAKTRSSFEVKISNFPRYYKKKDVKAYLKSSKPSSVRLAPNTKGVAYASFADEDALKKALILHKGFADGRRVQVIRVKSDLEHTVSESGQNQVLIPLKNATSHTEPTQTDEEETIKAILQTGRIFIRNLSYSVSEEDLRSKLQVFGPLTEMLLPIDSSTQTPKGFAFVTFQNSDDAVKAYKSLDNSHFLGRIMHLIAGDPKPPSRPQESQDNSTKKSKISNFKEQKNELVKSNSNNPVIWNSHFVRPNAVADIISDKLKVAKVDLLTQGNKKDSVAVRMALSETQILSEIQEYLVNAGVNLDSFSNDSTAKKSKTIILVKNLPAHTKEDEIRELFHCFGEIRKIIMPPYGLSALVQMNKGSDALSAFKRRSYETFKGSLLYLEWAPENVFDVPARDNSEVASTSQSQPSESELGQNATLLVSNISFESSESDLIDHFSQIGPVKIATIAKRQTSKGMLPCGSGIVQFVNASDAEKAIKSLHHSVLNNRKLGLRYASGENHTKK